MIERGLLQKQFLYLGLSVWLVYRILWSSLLAGSLPAHAHVMVMGGVAVVYLCSELFFGLIDRAAIIRVVLLAVAAAVWWFSGNSVFLELLVVIFLARGVEFRQLARYVAILTSVCVGGVIVASRLGIIPDYVWTGGGRIRHGLGFRYSTYVSHYLLNVVLLVGYSMRKFSAPLSVVAMAVNLWVFNVTDSRNSFFLVCAVFLTYWIARVFRLNSLRWVRPMGVIAEWIFPVLALVSVAAVLSYDAGVVWQEQINTLLSGRLEFSQNSVQEYGMSPFGQEIALAANGLDPSGIPTVQTGDFDTNVIDNSFVNILVLRGYISFGIMLVAFWMLGRQAKMKKDLWLCAVLCVIAVHSVIDPQLLSLEYNGLLLIFATYFSDRKAVT